MEEFWSKVSSFITADNIALLSVIITVLIFVISRRAEIRYKKHDDKKVQYLKLIDLTQKTLTVHKKDKKGEVILSDELRRQFFDTGASLLLCMVVKKYTANTCFFVSLRVIHWLSNANIIKMTL